MCWFGWGSYDGCCRRHSGPSDCSATCSWTIARTSGRPTGGGVTALGVDELGGPVELLLPAGPDEEVVVVLNVGGEIVE